jgi:hypothetical protein
MTLLIVAAARLGGLVEKAVRWPMENDVFCRAVKSLPESALAKSFDLYPGVAGCTCPDWADLMSLALHAGMVSYLSPEYRYFVLNVGPRAIRALVLREAITPEEMTQAEELWRAMAREAGSPNLPEVVNEAVTTPKS